MKNNKIMLKFVKQAFISILNFSGSLNNEPCLTRPTLTDLNLNELY